MVTSYFRPQTLDEAIHLLSQPATLPLGGGTLLTHNNDNSIGVVDLQALGLNKIHKVGEKLEIGATATLSSLCESAYIPDSLGKTLRLEAPLNIRNTGTIAGTIVSCDGRSPFATAMLALDAKLIFTPGVDPQTLGNYFPLRLISTGGLPSYSGKLITKIEIPLNIKLAFEYIARTPLDRPIVCIAIARWPSGRTRLSAGGWGKCPLLAMDGTTSDGSVEAAEYIFSDAGDEWASAEYRRYIAAVLAKRCLLALD
jgi:CO/xanthine dehydrogenase FAD-binding subunit